MSAARASVITILVGGLLLAAAVPSPAAGKAAGRDAIRTLRVAPAAPHATDMIRVTFRAGGLGARERYVVSVSSDGVADNCTPSYETRVPGTVRRGQRVVVKLAPNAPDGTVLSRRFCAGRARIRVGRAGPRTGLHPIAAQSLRIGRDGNYPEPSDGRARITVLDASAVTVRATGRPDRTLGLGGAFTGYARRAFVPNTPLAITGVSGSLTLRSILTDPLCTGNAYLTDFRSATGTLRRETWGDVAMRLELAADPISLAGCAAPTSGGTTSVVLTGRAAAAADLSKLSLSATIPDVQIGAGVLASVSVQLSINVELSRTD